VGREAEREGNDRESKIFDILEQSKYVWQIRKSNLIILRSQTRDIKVQVSHAVFPAQPHPQTAL